MSVRSPHVERILDGSKTVEIRRRPWNVPDGTTVLLYASGGTRAVVGSFVVEKTTVASRTAVWERFGRDAAITRQLFRDYTAGAPSATAIQISGVRKLDKPIPLKELRRRCGAFLVPQSYRFVGEAELASMLNGERSQLLPA